MRAGVAAGSGRTDGWVDGWMDGGRERGRKREREGGCCRYRRMDMERAVCVCVGGGLGLK